MHQNNKFVSCRSFFFKPKQVLLFPSPAWHVFFLYLNVDDGALSLEEFKAFFSDGILSSEDLEKLFHDIDTHKTK